MPALTGSAFVRAHSYAPHRLPPPSSVRPIRQATASAGGRLIHNGKLNLVQLEVVQLSLVGPVRGLIVRNGVDVDTLGGEDRSSLRW